MSGGETQVKIDANMKKIISQFPALFSAKTGKFQGPPIKIQVHSNATPVVQPSLRIPLHYMERLQSEIIKMSKDDIIEGPLEIEEPGTYISNLVITDKKWDPEKIRVTLDCQQVNKDVYQTHEPIPRVKNSGTSYRDVIASPCLTSETATINLKLKKKQGNCLHFALPGEHFAIKEWLWRQAQPAARYRSASEK